ncbi:sensor histidine kinase [Roseateles koreensis]|uniref:histidine kinase n=1 Tax=Roseateles koreensis TaxID=2987526 RepID=A0ABT5KSM9_9BURK|nr:HAMP domain-containing sensor histidine kinase [Roseateles koreensis]MDC8785942.1 HAMP domain-containing sensor histidine kinase [Roseateles koreensis]
MKSLYLRIYLTLVVVLLAFAFGSAWLFQRHLEQERGNFETLAGDRVTAMAELLSRALPPATAPAELQAVALEEWAQRLRFAVALVDQNGQRVAASELFLRREEEARLGGIRLGGPAGSPHGDGPDDRPPGLLDGPQGRFGGAGAPRHVPDLGEGKEVAAAVSASSGAGTNAGASAAVSTSAAAAALPIQVKLDDGRSLLVMRPRRLLQAAAMRLGAETREMHELRELRDARETRDLHDMRGGPMRPDSPWSLPLLGPRPNGQMLLILLVLLFLGVAAGAYPVVRRLTRRLESLKQGVERFGSGNLAYRVQDDGNDEVAALAGSFNRAAEQVEALLRAQQNLLANASHELRSPLARLKMAFSMLDESNAAQRARLATEIHTNIAELDALVEEVLLASRLESGVSTTQAESVDVLGMAAEEASRVNAAFEPAEGLTQLKVMGEDRLLRRAMRNLLENARRYGGDDVELALSREAGQAVVRVCDRGPGVPEPMRERIFEAFFRLPGHAEQAGGVGLGLSLVKQIANRHRGQVRCEGRAGGGSCFVLSLPLAD